VSRRRYRRPDKARTRRLLVRYHKQGDENARERVIQEQLPLAEFLARNSRVVESPWTT
jgi:RNA polymerase sigma-B factor